MISIRGSLAATALAVGAGAVVFLSTGQNPASPAPRAPFEPVPVAIPPAVTEVPSVHPAVPVVQRPAPPSTVVPAPVVQPIPKQASTPPAPARKVAPQPKRAAAPVTTQQPEPADTEPNGSGGWQLPACYDPSCVAQPEAYGPEQGSGTQALNAGPLGQEGIVNTIAGLIGVH